MYIDTHTHTHTHTSNLGAGEKRSSLTKSRHLRQIHARQIPVARQHHSQPLRERRQRMIPRWRSIARRIQAHGLPSRRVGARAARRLRRRRALARHGAAAASVLSRGLCCGHAEEMLRHAAHVPVGLGAARPAASVCSSAARGVERSREIPPIRK